MSPHTRQQLQADLNFGFFDASAQSDQLFHPHLISNENENTMLRAIRRELSLSQSFVFSVAFITTNALAQLKQALLDFNGTGKIVTSTYLNFNAPEMFRELLSLEGVTTYVHPETGPGFHAKGYVFEGAEQTTAIIGSSNLTQNALLRNMEWNLRISALPGGDVTQQLQSAISRQLSESSRLTADWIDEYQVQFNHVHDSGSLFDSKERSEIRTFLAPNNMQIEALAQIAQTREAGEQRALVISATGTGKTILAALDVRAAHPKKVLFIAHREQILERAKDAFEQVLEAEPSEVGSFVGQRQELDRRFVFATIQSLSQAQNLNKIPAGMFDYVLIDEVHRAGAESYRRVIDHLNPRFLLGLTATPERTDDFNVYELFDFNVPYEIRLKAALEADMLVPFHYYGVADYTDSAGNVIDEAAGISQLIHPDRIHHLVQNIERYGHSVDTKGLIFCSRREEAILLSELLNRQAVHGKTLRTIALSGTDNIDERENAVQMLERGELDYIATVDIFNEGIDIPAVNQIVMLRQTQSSIIFTQQLGRGLRKAPHKSHLRVIDFIGNYSNNYLIPIALLGNSSCNQDSIKRDLINADQAGAIAGFSSISFDSISRERVLSSLAATSLDNMKNIKSAYLALKQRLGKQPKLLDFARFDLMDPVVVATKAKNYWQLLHKLKAVESPPGKAEDHLLSFLSNELLNGKRPQELLLLKRLREGGPIALSDLPQFLSAMECNSDPATIASSLRVLSLDFHTNTEREKYGDSPLVLQGHDGRLQLSTEAQHLLDTSAAFREHFEDCIETGLFLARHNYPWHGALAPGSTYSRKDVCRLLNWKSNEYSTIYGYKVDTNSASCPIFVTYNKNAEVTASTRYEDTLLDHSTLRWFTRSRRTLESAEVQAIVENTVPLHVFAKKNDAEGSDFYYLGKATSSSAKQEKMPGNDGKHLNVVTMNLTLENPIEEGLYGYLTGR